ncbi:hypothetical protein J8F10_24215 [Gemmata sp. G18]|uniref:Uncharacterized protein n=1 Tax=Gemmata palustris TaxID=2822762 RepID=A0ABS5BX85_9BACT|nr:hypothetical protein [Gemmata palustris]MBP3958366.1 hypothetical protein [Gemmata palustris]
MITLADSLTATLQTPHSLGQVATKPNPHGAPKVSDSPPNTERRRSASDKERLSIALSQVCALQKQYGKTQAELETLVEGFCWALEDYPMDRILGALAQYVRTKSDIPAPADLVAIIDPPREPLSAAVYVGLKQRITEGYYPLSEERAFMRAFEAQEIDKAKGTTEYQQAWEKHPRKGALMIGSEEWRAKKEAEDQTTLAEIERWREAIADPTPQPVQHSKEERVRLTAEEMRRTGASETDVQEFLTSITAGKEAT